MPQLPENIRPAVALLAKHHFWLLAILAPLVLLPLLMMARGGLQTEITTAQSKIRGKFDALRAVRNVNPHPNEGWSTEIDAEAARIRVETLGEWKRFWDSQAFLRVWPPELGNDFLQAVADLKPDGRLDRNMLARYQNTIPDIVKKLPSRMGADEAMSAEAATAATDPSVANERKRATGALVVWNAGDQRRLQESFTWQRLPGSPQAATTQVLLAQEELWVYGLLCDAIKRANKDASGGHNAAITRVDQLAIGYPAAEAQPGGAGGSRIVMPKDAAAPGGEQAAVAMPAGPDGMAVRPPHPRFGGAAGLPVGGDPSAPTDGSPAAAPDSSLREWIYVDFVGKPLTAAELATSPAARTVHLVPFVLRITIDERKIDALLVDLAKQPVPIDVREVRINVGGGGPAASAAEPAELGELQGRAERRHDVRIELRGTVGLATPPNPAAIGIQPANQPAADSAAAKAAGPESMAADRARGAAA